MPVTTPYLDGLLEDENTRLKRLLADAMLDNAALKDLLGTHVRKVAVIDEEAGK